MSQPTNDLGVYRVWNLPAGDYIVGAWWDDQPLPDELPVLDGYLPTYFPGLTAFDAAKPVPVRWGQEAGGVDVLLQRGRLGAVTGKVIDASGGYPGAGVSTASVGLTARSQNPAYPWRSTGARSDGTFLFPNVPAGDYYVSATLIRGTGTYALREGGYVPVSVSGNEVGVTIQTNFGARISGRVIFEGSPLAQAGVPGDVARQISPVQVVIQSASTAQFVPAFTVDSSPGAVRPDGTFTLTGVRGPVQIAASGARAALKSVTRGGRDIIRQPLELLGTERIDDAVIVMTYDTGSLRGVVAGDEDEALPEASVLVVPDDPDTWSPGSPFVRTPRVVPSEPGGTAPAASTPGAVTAGQTPETGPGSFHLDLLAPGRYVVIAFADGWAAAGADRASIERWREMGTVVTVDAGQTAAVKVRAIK
jgi:hypothetical protein